MDFGIIGLARSGKTTVFNALTGGHAQTGGYGPGSETHIGVVKVPDQRLERLAQLFKPKKVTPIELRYLDFPASFDRTGGPGGQFLASLSLTNALIDVVRAFPSEAVAHPQGSIDPYRDIATMEMELTFADLAVIERRLDRLITTVRSARPGEREAGQKEMELLERIRKGLEGDTPIRAQGLSPEEMHALANYNFLTVKPVLHLINIGEGDVTQYEAIEEEYRARYHYNGTDAAVLCGELEMELTQLEPQEAQQFRQELGLPHESGRDRIVRRCQELMGLVTFYTVVGDECRAWTVPKGTSALHAAGRIHTDMERGFIRAEVISWEQMLEYGSLAEARKHGVLRTEGKGYVVQDGDVLHILFHV